jgi:hypothetical protein
MADVSTLKLPTPPKSAIVVSYSEIDTYRQCPLKHQLSYKERWRSDNKVGGALDRGTRWHQILEAHYRTLMEAQKPEGAGWNVADFELTARIAERLKPLLYNPQSGEFVDETAELLLWMYQGHLETWGFDPHWRILAVELGPVVPLLTPAGKRTRFWLKTKIDLVVQDRELGNHVWVVDHKSGKDLPRRKSLDIDDQFGLYTLALRRAGKKVFGQTYSAARTQRNKSHMPLDTRFGRYRLYREDTELAAIEADAVAAMTAAYGRGVAYSSPNTDSCTWKCDFLEPHIAARKTGRPIQELLPGYGLEQSFVRH